MIWYPWLSSSYKTIIGLYQKNYNIYRILLNFSSELGNSSLFYGISRWLLCKNRNNLKSCKECSGCKLMLAKTHPDYYEFTFGNIKSIGIQEVRNLIKFLSSCAQQNYIKVISFPYIDRLTESASNAFLNILESSKRNVYFLLGCTGSHEFFKDFRSKCFYYCVDSPEYETVFSWAMKTKASSLLSLKNLKIAMKLNLNSPIFGLKMLFGKEWFRRKKFLNLLFECISHKNILDFLPELDQKDVIKRIYWLISLLLDSVKYQFNAKDFCINQDQFFLIKKLATMNSSDILFDSIKGWNNCRYKLTSIVGLNKKLQLVSQLIKWKANLLNHG